MISNTRKINKEIKQKKNQQRKQKDENVLLRVHLVH